MMPRAANGFADHQSFREGTAVVRAGRSDGKYVLSLPDEHDWLAINVTQQRRILNQTFQADAGFEVRSLRFLRFVICHSETPLYTNTSFNSREWDSSIGELQPLLSPINQAAYQHHLDLSRGKIMAALKCAPSSTIFDQDATVRELFTEIL
jgi:hypothetical protein